MNRLASPLVHPADSVPPEPASVASAAPRPDNRLERRRRVAIVGALAVLWLGVGSALAIWLAWRVRNWSVMTDEMLYAKLATSIAETGSPLPRIHETPAAAYNVLYPLLLAPLYAAFSPPDAFRAAHVLNAFVMTSAAFPAYLLAREVLPRGWSFLTAALTITVPWMGLTGYLLTESVAYPAFLWAILAFQRAIARPSRGGDLLAVAAVDLAVAARTQFFVLVLVLPLAIVAHEIGRAFLTPGSRTRRRRLLDGVAEAVRRHRVLTVLYAIGGAVALALAVTGSLSGILGPYAITLEEGRILPSSTWGAAARHIDAVAIGLGIVPFVLGGGWMLAAAARPRSEREHALATLSLVAVVLVTIEVASFTVRFEGVNPLHELRDRYAFYVAPLLLVGAVAALTRTQRADVAIGAGLVTVFFSATVWQLPFPTHIAADALSNVVNRFLSELSGGLATGTFVTLTGLVLGAALVLGLLLLPRTIGAPIVVGALLGFSFLTLTNAVDRVGSSASLAGPPVSEPPGHGLDWVDSALPKDSAAAVVSFPVSRSWWTSAIRWWDVEFWNRSVTRALVTPDGHFTYTPWARTTLAFDWASGRVPGTSDAPAYIVMAASDPRFLLAGTRHAARRGLVVRSAERPYRAIWMSRGLDPDGWARPGRPATVRIFPVSGRASHVAQARVALRAPDGEPARYRISASGAVRVGRLAGGERQRVALEVCVPPRGPVDVTVAARSDARMEGVPLSPTTVGTRLVGARLGPISVTHTSRACRT